MMKNLLTCILSVLVIASCQYDETYEEGWTQLSPQETETMVTEESAVNEAISFLQRLKPSTRSIGTTDLVQSVYAWKKSEIYPITTRSDASTIDLPDTMLYIVNLSNNNGFILVSASDRLEESVVAYVEQGTLSPSDQIDNPGFRLFLDRLKTCYDLPEQGVEQLNGGGPVSLKDTTYVPLLTSQTWNQGEPFYSYCPMIGGKHTLVCCVALATGQIVAHHKHPSSYNNHPFLWNEIQEPISNSSAAAIDGVAHLLRDIGRIVDVSYGLDASTANAGNAQRALDSLGYNHSQFIAYDFDTCLENFSQGKPVYLNGFPSSNLGHAWVVDGAYLQWTEVYKKIVGPSINDVSYELIRGYRSKLIHCNWGWSGWFNGYFLSTAFNPNDAVISDGYEPDGSEYDVDLSNSLRMFCDISPITE